jgi:hypothetical protein
MNEVRWWLLFAAGFFVLACVELYMRLRKGTSLWRALREWTVKIVDILSGGG